MQQIDQDCEIQVAASKVFGIDLITRGGDQAYLPKLLTIGDFEDVVLFHVGESCNILFFLEGCDVY